ncbi:MAG: hypothetical protein WA063_00510 [Minisyncoccia bacterium]
MSHIAGKKVAKRHSTVIEESFFITNIAIKFREVSKIITGEIVVIRHGPRRIKFVQIPAGLKATVRGVGARQYIYVYTDDPDSIRKRLEDLWEKKYGA